MPRYTFSRRSIVEETFEVVARSEQEALDLIQEDSIKVKTSNYVWVDWAEDDYYLAEVEDELVMFTNGESVNG